MWRKQILYVFLFSIALSLFERSVTASCCEEGETMDDPNDCSRYFQCCGGEFVEKDCPCGDYWNITSGECEVDNGQCRSNCTEGYIMTDPDNCSNYLICLNGQYVTQPCITDHYWNSDTEKCEVDNGQCKGNCNSNCTENVTEDIPGDCTSYRICTNGQYVVKSCATGYYWNSNTKKCEVDNGQCNGSNCTENDTEVIPGDCTSYRICTNGQYVVKSCATGYYWNSVTKKCEVDNGQCNGSNCTENDTEVIPGDCTSYRICTNGQYVVKSCATGYYWNSVTKKCEVDNGQCNGSNCTENVTEDIPGDCTSYRICTNGQYVVKSCATGNYWNSVTKKCEVDNGQCNGSSCTEKDTEVIPGDCTSYRICTNGQYVVKSCATGNYWNSNTKKCEVDNGQCTKICDTECCDVPNNWMGSIENNCSAFMYCINGIKVVQNCPNNLQFNNATKECDYPHIVQCVDDGPSGPIAGPSGLYCESTGNCSGQRDGTMFGDKSNACSGSYVVCQCECEVAFTCSAGLVFNEKIRSCDWPANMNC